MAHNRFICNSVFKNGKCQSLSKPEAGRENPAAEATQRACSGSASSGAIRLVTRSIDEVVSPADRIAVPAAGPL
jgi:hypothetical protein